jgi:hypothetical protein
MTMSQAVLVDTEDLESKAARLSELSGIFRDMGGRMNRACLSMPDYGGQLSGPAAGAAAQILYETGAMRDSLQWHGDFLGKTAAQFSAVDDYDLENWINYYREVAVCWWNIGQYFLLGKEPLEGDMADGYRGLLACEEEGTVVTIWHGGEPIRFDFSDPSLSPEERNRLAAQLADFKEAMQSCLSHLRDYLGGNEGLLWTALGLLSSSATKPGDFFSLLAKFGGIGETIKGSEDDYQKSLQEYEKAARIWRELNAKDQPGKTAVD